MKISIIATLKALGGFTHAHKHFIVGALKYGLGLALLALVLTLNWKDISEAVRKPLNPMPLLWVIVLVVPAVVLTIIRWFVLVRAQDLPFTFFNGIRLGLVGFAFNMLMPGSIGGDIIKAVGIARSQSRRTVAVATVMIDRLVGLWGLCWLVALFGGAYWYFGNEAINRDSRLQQIVVMAATVDVLSLVAWFLLGLLPEWWTNGLASRLERIPRVGHSFAEFWRAICMYRKKRGSVLASLAISFVAQIGFVLMFYLAAQVFSMPNPSLTPQPSLAEHFLIVPIGLVVQAVIPTPGGIGAGELSFGQLYGLLNPHPGNEEALRQMIAWGALASLVSRMVNTGMGLVGYLIYLRMKPSLPPATDDRTVVSPGEKPSLAKT